MTWRCTKKSRDQNRHTWRDSGHNLTRQHSSHAEKGSARELVYDAKARTELEANQSSMKHYMLKFGRNLEAVTV